MNTYFINKGLNALTCGMITQVFNNPFILDHKIMKVALALFFFICSITIKDDFEAKNIYLFALAGIFITKTTTTFQNYLIITFGSTLSYLTYDYFFYRAVMERLMNIKLQYFKVSCPKVSYTRFIIPREE